MKIRAPFALRSKAHLHARTNTGCPILSLRNNLTPLYTLCRLPTMHGEMKPPRLTEQTLRVLGAILSCGLEEVSGAEIATATNLASGTLYPILLRLEQAKWLDSRWENESPQELKRPRRRLYKVTALGSKRAKEAFRTMASAFGELVWP
jgi:PadR family transcriptional regulator PadR